MRAQAVCPVSDESAVGAARRTAAQLATAAGLSETYQGRLGIVVTELARNIVRHAGRGSLLMQEVREGDAAGIDVLAVDSGPGLGEPERCMSDGYSTAGTAGNGMGAVRRLSSEFDLYTQVGAGTVVLSRIVSGEVPSARTLQWGAVSSCAPGERRCGDGWSLARENGAFALLVADGLGHGDGAAEAAECALSTFDRLPFRPPQDYFDDAHRQMHGKRGAAVAVAQLGSGTGSLLYAGVGNIAARILTPDGRTRGLVSNNGTVGGQMRSVRAYSYDWGRGDLLVMYSDGLRNAWSLDGYPGLPARHPAVIAAVLHRDFRRGPDDSTVVVVRQEG